MCKLCKLLSLTNPNINNLDIVCACVRVCGKNCEHYLANAIPIETNREIKQTNYYYNYKLHYLTLTL